MKKRTQPNANENDAQIDASSPQILVRGVTSKTHAVLSREASKLGQPNINRLIAQVLNKLGDRPDLLTFVLHGRDDQSIAAEKLAWANHWLERARHGEIADRRRISGYLALALAGYADIVEFTAHTAFIGFAQFARYRLAFCLLMNAIELEREALATKNGELLHKAEMATVLASSYHDEYRKYESIAPIIALNEACGLALRCRIVVHDFILQAKPDLLAFAVKCDDSDFQSGMNKLWGEDNDRKSSGRLDRSLGTNWRELVPNQVHKKVQNLAHQAIGELTQLTINVPSKNLPAHAGAHLWTNLAKRDDDLLFLRCAIGIREAYYGWLSSWEAQVQRVPDADLPINWAMEKLPNYLIENAVNEIRLLRDE